MEAWTVETLIGLLGMPSALAVVVAWLIEQSETFQTLTKRQKVLAFLFGCLALAWLVAGIGLWLGLLVFSKALIVNTFLAGAAAFYFSQAAHLRDQGK